MVNKNLLTYRQSTIAIILNKKGEILIIQKKGWHDNEWSFPGGGVEDGETSEQAINRELREELGTDKLILMDKSSTINRYEWPDEVIEKKFQEKGHTWRGQQVAQFLFNFTGSEDEITCPLDEIQRSIWVNIKELQQYLIFPNQFENIKKLLEEFKIL